MITDLGLTLVCMVVQRVSRPFEMDEMAVITNLGVCVWWYRA